MSTTKKIALVILVALIVILLVSFSYQIMGVLVDIALILGIVYLVILLTGKKKEK